MIVSNISPTDCPTQEVLRRISDKWTVLIGMQLAEQPHRFGELLNSVTGISKKMLAQTLRSLEHDGLVTRSAHPTVPITVEYALTPLGKTLVIPIMGLSMWAEEHIEAVRKARAVYDSNHIQA
jgi:DNA-binding HxlR family transcriptional regulator